VLWAAFAAAAVVLGPATTHAGEFVLGVEMPKRAIADGPYRYVTSATLRDVLKFFRKKFKRSSHTFIDAIDHPKAKVVHIRSGEASTAWEGINVSLYGNRVHIFVIPRARELRRSGADAREPGRPGADASRAPGPEPRAAEPEPEPQ